MPSETIFRRHLVCYHIHAPSYIILKRGGAPFLNFQNSRTCLPVRQSRTGKISRLFKKAPQLGQYAGECLVPAPLS
ncbi:TPA: hypothetical protein ACFRGQ_000685 [Neisseria lactamica]|uniref:hypothetical protein n=1 Tax=Neisseria lactamica TaxID=486 RepID=UPI001290332C|nr:hypothetical protein [Neisseria lactamica]